MPSDKDTEAQKEERECDGAACCSCLGCSLCVFTFAGALVAVWVYGPTKLLQAIFLRIPEDPGWDWFWALCAFTSFSITTMMPIWPPLCMLAGLIFGLWWGALSNMIAIYSAACVSICLGRWLLRDRIQSCVHDGNYSEIRRMMKILEDEEDSLKMLTLFRFLFIPIFIRNYGPSTLDVPLWKLLVSAIPHCIWISILFASLGATFKDTAQLLREGKQTSFKSMRWQQLLVFVVALSVAIGLSFYAYNKYKAILAREEASGLIETPETMAKLRMENAQLRQEVEELKAAPSANWPWQCARRKRPGGSD